MTGTFLDHQICLNTCLLELLDDQLGLLKGNESILIAVDNQCRGIVGANVPNR